MSDKKQQTAYPLRMPADLRAEIESAADESKRSVNAEIIARLEETFDIDKVLADVAPGAPITGTAGLLYELDKQIREQDSDQQSLAISAVSKEVTEALSSLEILPFLSAVIAIQGAFPEAMTKQQKERLLQAVATMVGSDSREPGDLLQALSSRLIGRALSDDIGL